MCSPLNIIIILKFCVSRLSELVVDLEEILTNRVDVELISDLFEDVNLLADIWPRLRDGNTTGKVTPPCTMTTLFVIHVHVY